MIQMVRKLKGYKKFTFERFGFISVGDIEFPVKTSGMDDIRLSLIKLKEDYKLPSKTRRATADEIKELIDDGQILPDNKMGVIVREFDRTSSEYIKLQEDLVGRQLILEIALNIDLDYEIDENIKLWQELELKDNKDVLGLCDWFNKRKIKNEDIEFLKSQVQLIQNSNFKSYEEYETFESLLEDIQEGKKITSKDKRLKLLSEVDKQRILTYQENETKE